MKIRYWMMNEEYDFIEVSNKEYNNEKRDDGEFLINNSIVATIYEDSILWDVNFWNVHGSDIGALDSIVKSVELEELGG